MGIFPVKRDIILLAFMQLFSLQAKHILLDRKFQVKKCLRRYHYLKNGTVYPSMKTIRIELDPQGLARLAQSKSHMAKYEKKFLSLDFPATYTVAQLNLLVTVITNCLVTIRQTKFKKN